MSLTRTIVLTTLAGVVVAWLAIQYKGIKRRAAITRLSKQRERYYYNSGNWRNR